MKILKKRLRKYLILGTQDCNQPIENILLESIKGGITAFQFREKGVNSKSGDEKYELALKLQSICELHNVLYFINDDVALAMDINADGIHVGQNDGDLAYIRKRNPNKIIGYSISTLEEFINSDLTLIDYIGAGPMYPTISKPDAKKVVGIEWIRRLKTRTQKPIVAIGGINESNVSEVLKSGADGICVISAVARSKNIKKTIQNL